MDKTFLVTQLQQKVRAQASQAERFALESRQEAGSGAQRAVNLARASKQHLETAHQALEDLALFKPAPLPRGARIGLGAIVEVEDGELGRTLFLAPAGAGVELEGPGGDGLFQVVTPASPLGRALMGKKVGDVVEVTVKGELTEWDIVWAA